MKKYIAFLLTIVLFACQETKTKSSYNYIDPHSYSKPDQVKVTHLDLELTVDFENKFLKGVASWTIENNGYDTIFFDSEDLNIEKVVLDDQVTTTFFVGEKDQILGQELAIMVQPETKKVSIYYSTPAEAKALQWLSPQQTNDKKNPFLFTQSQAILARTWIPCQDSPGIRYTYEAKVKVPNELMALMSADNPQEKSTTGEYSFSMKNPIPSYLMALAVGDLEFASVSDRTGLYAEPGMLSKAEYEFADMETMVQKAEDLYGSYAWGRYDLIVLPPSFPFGGMENPKLTFATPTILAGDRSLVALVAHELAHSWSGNLVTNKTWNDFWLNEGFTVYFEMRIMEAVYGRDYSEMIASISHQDMSDDIAELILENVEDTHLKLDLAGRNPDDGMTSVAYDKGYHFLRLCEETVGRDTWDEFLKNYFQGHKFQVMDTETFIDLLKSKVLSESQIQSIDIDAWVYGPGVPSNCPIPHSDKFHNVENILNEYLETGDLPKRSITNQWSSHEWVHFIRMIPNNIKSSQIEELDKKYRFTNSGNNEVLAAWWQPVIKVKYEDAYGRMERFLVTVGRRKFLTPTYRTLKETNQLDWAIDVYAKARPNYHSVSRETMDELLEI